MEYKKLNGYYVVRMDPKEEIMETLMGICEKENITCAKVEAIGALTEFTVGVYKVDEKNGSVYYKYINSVNRVSRVDETWIKELEVE